MPVILWTDGLVFLLVSTAGIFAWWVARREHLRAPWRRVARSRLGMGAAVVLSGFLVIGLLDSMHFHPSLRGDGGETRYSPEVLSVFDHLATPLRERVETTYSAPFALYLYTGENLRLPDGRQVRDFPRLRYGGAHLAGPKQRLGDILWTSVRGALEALGVWLTLALLLVAGLARRHGRGLRTESRALFKERDGIPWRVILGAVGVSLILTVVSARLGVKYHLFGTDKVGQDVFYLTLKSIRTGLLIGTLTTMVMLPFAVLLGIMAGYFRGWVDDVIQYLYTTLNSVPGVLLIAASILMVQVYIANHAERFSSLADRADMRLLFLCIILGITSWTGLCRLLRGETLKLREMDYIQAAHAFGVGHMTIIIRHILPNVMHIVLITVVLDFSGLVLAEAVLSYVNIGVDPTTNSWGNMINSARLEMAREPIVWWSLASAFLFMFALVLAANLFSDAVRDAFDPKLVTRDER